MKQSAPLNIGDSSKSLNDTQKFTNITNVPSTKSQELANSLIERLLTHNKYNIFNLLNLLNYVRGEKFFLRQIFLTFFVADAAEPLEILLSSWMRVEAVTQVWRMAAVIDCSLANKPGE